MSSPACNVQWPVMAYEGGLDGLPPAFVTPHRCWRPPGHSGRHDCLCGVIKDETMRRRVLQNRTEGKLDLGIEPS